MQMASDIEIMAEYRRIAASELDPRYEVQALVYAKRKLKSIIERYGDENGSRLSPKYAAILMAEEIAGGILEPEAYRPDEPEEKQEEKGTSMTPPRIIAAIARIRGAKATSRPEKETARHEVSQDHYNAFTPICQ